MARRGSPADLQNLNPLAPERHIKSPDSNGSAAGAVCAFTAALSVSTSQLTQQIDHAIFRRTSFNSGVRIKKLIHGSSDALAVKELAGNGLMQSARVFNLFFN